MCTSIRLYASAPCHGGSNAPVEHRRVVVNRRTDSRSSNDGNRAQGEAAGDASYEGRLENRGRVCGLALADASRRGG